MSNNFLKFENQSLYSSLWRVEEWYFHGFHMTSSKHDYPIYDQLAPSFDVAYKTIQSVSVPDLKSIRHSENKNVV